jgi:hypothetical protein
MTHCVWDDFIGFLSLRKESGGDGGMCMKCFSMVSRVSAPPNAPSDRDC